MNNIPSTAAQVMVTIIPIAGIFMGSVLIFFYLLWGYKSRRMMIEKGIYRREPVNVDMFSLFLGLVLAGIGLSLIIFFMLKNGLGYSLLSGLIPFSFGVSLLLFFVVRMKTAKRDGKTER